jgi:hypothetical protein
LNKADKLKALELSQKYSLDLADVELMVKEPYEFIREKTKELTFEDNLTKEEFKKMKTNFNLPAIGKLYASHYLYGKIQENKNKKKLDKQ